MFTFLSLLFNLNVLVVVLTRSVADVVISRLAPAARPASLLFGPLILVLSFNLAERDSVHFKVGSLSSAAGCISLIRLMLLCILWLLQGLRPMIPGPVLLPKSPPGGGKGFIQLLFFLIERIHAFIWVNIHLG